jgi:hypothetical protein
VRRVPYAQSRLQTVVGAIRVANQFHKGLLGSERQDPQSTAFVKDIDLLEG